MTRPADDPALADLWRFVRGDADDAALEQWIYARSDELDSRLGKQAALQVLAADYRSPEAVAQVKELLREYAERVSNLECRCLTLPNVAVIDMGDESESVLATIEERRSRGEPFWWLWCGECTSCGQWWLVAQEERQNDVFCLRRLTDSESNAVVEHNIWPADLDSYETLLRLGLNAGQSVRFAEPEQAQVVALDHRRPRQIETWDSRLRVGGTAQPGYRHGRDAGDARSAGRRRRHRV